MSETDKAAQQDQVTVIDCGNSLDIRGIEEFRAGLVHAFEAEKPISLLAKDIDRIDTSGLQILCALVHDAKAKNISVKWESPSQAMLDAARYTGLTESLGL